MARILIWSLGTGARRDDRLKGEYRTANYFVDGVNEPIETQHIYEALMKFYDFDKFVVIGTSGSCWNDFYLNMFYENDKNPDYCNEYWKDLCDLYDKAEHKNDDVTIVRDKLEPLKTAFGGKCAEIIVIKYGLDKDELLFNFKALSKIAEQINDGDSLSFDITHSFRSLAFYELLAMSYFKDVVKKNVKIELVTYGMFEANNEFNGKTPIVNMKPLVDILEWIKAAEEYNNFGTAYTLVKLYETGNIGFELGNEERKALMRLGDVISGNDIIEFKLLIKNCGNIVRIIESGQSNEHIVIGWIFNDLYSTFGDELNDDYLLRFELAKWHYEKNRGFIAAITLSETLLDFFADISGIKRNPNSDDHHLKEKISLAHSNNSIVRQHLNNYSNIARKIRNDVCHGKPLKGDKDETLEMIIKYFRIGYKNHFKDNEQNREDLRKALQ